MTPLAVVAGIVRGENGILIARRKSGGAQALKWEFPGGKIEPGESPQAALARELKEELDISVSIGRIYDAVLWYYPEKTVLILFYDATILSGTPASLDNGGFEWVQPSQITQYDFADADKAVAKSLGKDAAV